MFNWLVPEPDGHADVVIQAGVGLVNAARLGEVVLCTRWHRAGLPVVDGPVGESAHPSDRPAETRLRSEHLLKHAAGLAAALGVPARPMIDAGEDPSSGHRRCCTDKPFRPGPGGGQRPRRVVRLPNGSVIPGLITASPVPVMPPLRQPLRRTLRRATSAESESVSLRSHTGSSS